MRAAPPFSRLAHRSVDRRGERGDEAGVDLSGVGDTDGVLEGAHRLPRLWAVHAVGRPRIVAAVGEERLDLLDQRLSIGLGNARRRVAFIPTSRRRADPVRLGKRRLCSLHVTRQGRDEGRPGEPQAGWGVSGFTNNPFAKLQGKDNKRRS